MVQHLLPPDHFLARLLGHHSEKLGLVGDTYPDRADIPCVADQQSDELPDVGGCVEHRGIGGDAADRNGEEEVAGAKQESEGEGGWVREDVCGREDEAVRRAGGVHLEDRDGGEWERGGGEVGWDQAAVQRVSPSPLRTVAFEPQLTSITRLSRAFTCNSFGLNFLASSTILALESVILATGRESGGSWREI